VHKQAITREPSKETDAIGYELKQPVEKRVMNDLKQSFKPEFQNRITSIVIFNALNADLLKQIVEIQITG
jgi:ATP-dependent Clp protease ATP-binding subunit ClpA